MEGKRVEEKEKKEEKNFGVNTKGTKGRSHKGKKRKNEEEQKRRIRMRTKRRVFEMARGWEYNRGCAR